ncbi:DoxX-like family protein [Rapidithrix thailandica]|uniref:DoxX-like family protein n=1 Tax=Rapidithrix thailandica TaxID=413964 RepID=A0AAW9SCH5_9BACT
MNAKTSHKLLTFSIALVWFINGFYCKILNLVPRHQQIVAHILGNENADIFTKMIGTSEVFMVVWIISRTYSRINAITQILIVVVMNILELIIAPDLLLWGKFNLLFALLFCILVYFNEFILNRKTT